MIIFKIVTLVIAIIIILLIFIKNLELRLQLSNYTYSSGYCSKLYESNNNSKIKLYVYLFGKIKIFSKKIINAETRARKSKNSNINLLTLFKKLKIKKINLEVLVGFEDVLVTSYLVGLISAIFPNLIRNNVDNYSEELYKYKILPIYNKGNTVYIKLDCIFSIKIVHIIDMLKSKKIGEKRIYERTSN